MSPSSTSYPGKPGILWRCCKEEPHKIGLSNSSGPQIRPMDSPNPTPMLDPVHAVCLPLHYHMQHLPWSVQDPCFRAARCAPSLGWSRTGGRVGGGAAMWFPEQAPYPVEVLEQAPPAVNVLDSVHRVSPAVCGPAHTQEQHWRLDNRALWARYRPQAVSLTYL